MNKYKAIFFDLDGTLLDTALDIMAACNYTLDKYNYAPLSEDILRKKITAGMREMLKLGVPESQWDSAGVSTCMRDCFAKYYTEHICDTTKEFDGVTNLLESLHDSSIHIAVITNKYYAMAQKILQKFSFYPQLELILGCDSVTHSKPDPEPLYTAMKFFNVSAKDCLYVGDHLNDIQASNNANMNSALALWGYGKNECADIDTWGATYKVENVSSLKKLIFC